MKADEKQRILESDVLTTKLQAVASASELAPLRATLLLRGFARISATAYHANIIAADQADALGYPQLA